MKQYTGNIKLSTVLIFILILSIYSTCTYYWHYLDIKLFWLISGLTVAMILLHPIINKYIIQIYTFFLAIIAGTYGFMMEAVESYQFTNALYSTVRLFVFDTDQVFTKQSTKFLTYPPAIELARWSAVLYISATIAQILMRVFGSSIQQLRMWIFGNHVVILGLNSKSAILAADLLKQKRKVLILSEEHQPEEEELKKLGAVVLITSLIGDFTYQKAALHKSKYIVAFHDEDGLNLDLVHAVNEYLNKRKKKKCKVSLYIKQNHSITQKLFDQVELAVSNNLELHPITLHSLIARQLLNEYPIYENYEIQARDSNADPFHLLFIGFGETGQQIAIEALQRAHFYNSKKMHITIIDRQAARAEREWREAYPRLDDIAEMSFIQQDIAAKDIVNDIKEASPNITHIYICLNSDEEDVLQALRLNQQFKDIPIFVKLKRNGKFADWLHEANEFSQIKRFGSWEKVLTEDIVIREAFDEAAKLVHEAYEKEQKLTETPWVQLSYFHKNSNRAQVDHLQTKLFLLGLQQVDEHEEELVESDFKLILERDKEKLARIEHKRWNAFHILNGWDTLPLAQVTKEKHKDNYSKLHGCLVSWEELIPVSKKREIDFQAVDRKPVEEMFNLTVKLKKVLIKRQEVSC